MYNNGRNNNNRNYNNGGYNNNNRNYNNGGYNNNQNYNNGYDNNNYIDRPYEINEPVRHIATGVKLIVINYGREQVECRKPDLSADYFYLHELEPFVESNGNNNN